MKTIFYDWLGLNEGLFTALYGLNTPLVNSVWRIFSYGYSVWAVAAIALAISAYYLKIRHVAPEHQLATMSDAMAVLILGFSLVWCVVFTVQTVTLWPAPWVQFPDVVPAHSPMLWHEGFPASAPAIAMMITAIFWRYANRVTRVALVVYVVVGCVFSVVSGHNWPVDVAVALLVSVLGVRLSRWYYGFGIKLAGS